MGLVLLLAVLALGINLFVTGSTAAQAARLTEINGMVEAAAGDDSGDWHFVAGGEQVREGQRIRTYADSGAVLVFKDGSRTAIGPNSDLVLAKLNGSGDGLQVQLTQYYGTTSNDVIPLRGSGSFFLVDTPTGQASVHGTSFQVNVEQDGAALFAVSHGKVEVKSGVSAVFLASGQTTSLLPGSALAAPAYQFSLEGTVESIVGSVWKVAGVQFSVTPSTTLLGTFKTGDAVVVQGHVVSATEWVADRIEPARKDKVKTSFTGMIESMPGVPGTWRISGQDVQVNAETDVDPGLKIGSAVKVVFVALPNNGGMLAKEIESLEDVKPVPSRTATATLTGTPGTGTPTVTASPTVSGTPATPTVTATVMPKNDSNRCEARTQQHPDGVRLAFRYEVTYEEIIDWFCKGFGFGEIDLAYSLSQATGKPAADIFAMRSSGMSWGHIKQQLSSLITPTPKKNNGGPKLERTPNPNSRKP
jgi:hypothetical protein